MHDAIKNSLVGLETDAWSIGWVIYLIMIAYSLAMQLMCTTAAASWQLISCKRRMMRKKVQEVKGPVAVVVPCYLPNEAEIIKETIHHHLFATTLIEELDLYIVYNTPVYMDIEAELSALAKAPLPAGRRLFIQNVERSKSKAANLNHAISQINNTEYIAIYDADHHADPTSLAMAVGYLQETGTDCVQGSTYIRDGRPFLRMLIQAEFFVTYFANLPAAELLVGNGWFGGANAVWRAGAVKQMDFDTQAMTEDIDCCVRGVLDHGFSFKFLPECRSGELTPAGWHALWKQRLRWAMGWDEVTLKYAGSLFKCNTPLRKRAGMLFLLVSRWPTQFLGFIILFCNADAAVTRVLAPNAIDNAPQTIQILQTFSFLLMVLWFAIIMMQAMMHEPNFRFLACLLVFLLGCMPVYGMFTVVLLITSLTKVTRSSNHSWDVTTRAANSPKSEPLLQVEEDKEDDSQRMSEMGNYIAGFGLLVMGSLIGAIGGAELSKKSVVHPIFAWFGLVSARTVHAGQHSAHTPNVVDGRNVVMGCICGGVCTALVLFLRFLRNRSLCR